MIKKVKEAIRYFKKMEEEVLKFLNEVEVEMQLMKGE